MRDLQHLKLSLKEILLTIANCPLCNSNSETTLHILRDCPLTKLTWITFQLPNIFFNDDFKTWLKTNVSNLNINKLDIPSSTIFSFTIRSIWLVRNKLLFKNNQNTMTFNPTKIANIALSKSVEFWSNNPHPPLLMSTTINHSTNILVSPNHINSSRTPWQTPPPSTKNKIGTNSIVMVLTQTLE